MLENLLQFPRPENKQQKQVKAGLNSKSPTVSTTKSAATIILRLRYEDLFIIFLEILIF